MAATRRAFLRDGALALVSLGTLDACAPSFLRRAVMAAEKTQSNQSSVLVCLFQRGAVDGLSMAPPFGDPLYRTLRPALAIDAPGNRAANAVLDLDGFYGLHPSLASLKSLYDEGSLALVHACGSPHGTRSHFEAQDFMESGTAGGRKVASGWLARTLLHCPESSGSSSPLRAVSLTNSLPLSLAGAPKALAIPNLSEFGVRSASGASNSHPFAAMYSDAGDKVIGSTGREALEAIRLLKSLAPEGYRPAPGAVYPRGRLGDSLRQIAQLIKSDAGVRVAFTDVGGWDTHVNQGGAAGSLANRLLELGNAISAFWMDLESRQENVVLLTMSEFGRTVRQNGSLGTDHGHGTCFMVMGGPVRGGKVYGKWPGLEREQLHEARDLAVTTDFRNLFAELASGHMGATKWDAIFPGLAANEIRFPGTLKG